jgi:hypothetical protein
MLLLPYGQVQPDTPRSHGNYVIGLGNYVIVIDTLPGIS